MMYDIMSKTEKMLEEKLRDLKEKVKSLPSGKIFCAKNGKGYKWYHSDGHKATYIYKSDRRLAQKLALKKYYELEIVDAEKELKATKCYLTRYKPLKELEDFLDKPSECRNLIKSYLKPLKEDLLQWSQEEYDKNDLYPEALIHKSMSGKLLRSKSEAMIDSCLYRYQVPYRYEAAMQLGDLTIFPDFIIRHPKTGEIFIWEHFGVMDDPEYAKKTARKLDLYISWGYIPTINLITTYETKDKPLGMDAIEKIVKYYFAD